MPSLASGRRVHGVCGTLDFYGFQRSGSKKTCTFYLSLSGVISISGSPMPGPVSLGKNEVIVLFSPNLPFIFVAAMLGLDNLYSFLTGRHRWQFSGGFEYHGDGTDCDYFNSPMTWHDLIASAA